MLTWLEESYKKNIKLLRLIYVLAVPDSHLLSYIYKRYIRKRQVSPIRQRIIFGVFHVLHLLKQISIHILVAFV
jgi:hypothetical protein